MLFKKQTSLKETTLPIHFTARSMRMQKTTYWYNNPEILQSHWRKGTMTYVFALSIIAILSLSSHSLTQSIIIEQEATARIVNLAGRQRILSQRIIRIASEIAQNPDQLNPIKNSSNNYLELIDGLKKAHYALINGEQELKIPAPNSVNIKKIFFEAPINLDKNMNLFFELAELVNSPISHTNKNLAYKKLMLLSDNLLSSLDILVFQYQKES